MTHLGRREWDNDVFETRKNVKWKKSEKNTDEFFYLRKPFKFRNGKVTGLHYAIFLKLLVSSFDTRKKTD